MKEVYTQKANFVKGLQPSISAIVDKNIIYGVSIAPICSKNNKKLLCLGKERDGIFLDQFNYFGGQIQDKLTAPFLQLTKQEKATAICEVLFEETCEEFGIILDIKLFLKSLLGVIKNPYKDGYSLIFVCHIEDIQSRVWKAVMLERHKDPYLPWNLQEMSEIKYIDVDKKENISLYVESSLHLLRPFFEDLKESNRVTYESFKLTYGYDI